jgi:hypothetical protein
MDLERILARLGEIERALGALRLVKSIGRAPDDALNDLESQQVSELMQMVAQLRADIGVVTRNSRKNGS